LNLGGTKVEAISISSIVVSPVSVAIAEKKASYQLYELFCSVCSIFH